MKDILHVNFSKMLHCKQQNPYNLQINIALKIAAWYHIRIHPCVRLVSGQNLLQVVQIQVAHVL